MIQRKYCFFAKHWFWYRTHHRRRTFTNDRGGEISLFLLPPLSSVPSPLPFCPSPPYPVSSLSYPLPSCLFPLPFYLPHPLNPARRSGERCNLSLRVRAEPGRQMHFAAFSGWNMHNFCRWHNNTFIIILNILLFLKMTTKFLLGQLEGIAPTTFWPWGWSPPWSRRLWYTSDSALLEDQFSPQHAE